MDNLLISFYTGKPVLLGLKEMEMDRIKPGVMVLFTLLFLSILLQSHPLHAITWCHDYTWYRVTGNSVGINGKQPSQLRTLLEAKGYSPFNYAWKMHSTIKSGDYATVQKLETDDIFIIGESHSGIIVDNQERADHYIQPDGSKTTILTLAEVKKQKNKTFFEKDPISNVLNRIWTHNPKSGELMHQPKISFEGKTFEVWRKVRMEILPSKPQVEIKESIPIEFYATSPHSKTLIKIRRYVGKKFGNNPIELVYASKKYPFDFWVRKPSKLILRPASKTVRIGEDANFDFIAVYKDGEERDLGLIRSKKAPSHGEFDVHASYGGMQAVPSKIIARGKLLKVWAKPSATQTIKPGETAEFTVYGKYDELGKEAERIIDRIQISANDEQLVNWRKKEITRSYGSLLDKQSVRMTVILKDKPKEPDNTSDTVSGMPHDMGEKQNIVRLLRGEPLVARKCRYLRVTPPKAVVRVSTPDTITFRAIAVFNDGSQQDVTNSPDTIWTPGPSNTYTPRRDQLITESIKIQASWQGCKGTAEVTSVSRPVSSADQVDAKAPPPPADAYTWFALCNKKTGEVTYGKHPDPIQDFIMGGPFPGPRTAQQWIDQNCPNWRCTLDGVCAKKQAKGGAWKVLCGKSDLQIYLGKTYDVTNTILVEEGFLGEPDARAWVDQNYPSWSCTRTGAPSKSPQRGGPWGVFCNRKIGRVVVTKEPGVDHHKLEGNFHSLTDGQLWIEQHYPSGLCDNMGRYDSGWGVASPFAGEDAQGNISSNSGWGTWDPAEKKEMPAKEEFKKEGGQGSDDFAAPGSLSAQNAIQETEEMRPRGQKYAENLNKMMGEYERIQDRQEAQANQFFQEGMTATIKAAGDIAASNIKRKAGSKTKTPVPSYNLGPVGPNYNPADGWGKPGQVPSGAIKCPENQDEREAKCRQANEYIQKYNALSESSKTWDANIQRAYLYRSQCCGYRWTNDGSGSDTGNSGGMSRTECIHNFCPECAEAISLMGVSADSGCEACKERNAANIDQCVSGGSNSSTSQSGQGDIGDYGHNPKVYYVFERYQPGQNNHHYTIGKKSNNALGGRRMIYGPDTFEGCRAWAIQKGHW